MERQGTERLGTERQGTERYCLGSWGGSMERAQDHQSVFYSFVLYEHKFQKSPWEPGALGDWHIGPAEQGAVGHSY